MSAEPDLMRTLYADHAGVLLSFALRYTRDWQRAEDVVQETLLRAWRNADRLDAEGNVRAYLLTICRNVLTDLWRADGRRPQLVSDDETLADAPEAHSVDFDAAVDAWVVEQALVRLSREHREVIRALHFLRLSVAEASRALGVPPGTIKSRSYYAVRSLRTVLEEMGVVR